jgi:hypothetical protein
MTDEEREIRNSERRTLAEVRRWRRNVAKQQAGMTWEEIQEDNVRAVKKIHEFWGIPFESSDIHPYAKAELQGD